MIVYRAFGAQIKSSDYLEKNINGGFNFLFFEGFWDFDAVRVLRALRNYCYPSIRFRGGKLGLGFSIRSILYLGSAIEGLCVYGLIFF